MQMTFNAFMKSEGHLHQQDNQTDYANGYRERKLEVLVKNCETIRKTHNLNKNL